MIEGSCLCGAIGYQVTGPFNSMTNCHCSMCRKHHGSAFATYVSVPLERFQWTRGEDKLLRYPSSPHGTRDSCTVCGSTVPMTVPEASMAFLPAGPLVGDLDIKPEAHIFVGSKAPWYTITDTLPQHEEYPPEMGVAGLDRPKVEAQPGNTVGSCLCGAVAFEAAGEPMFMQHCHCTRCRRVRGAAHGTNIFYKAAQFRWTRGAELVSEYKFPEARFYTVGFCRQCGGALPKVTPGAVAAIPAGTLDTDPPIRPQRHIFTHYKATWFDITDSLPQFAEAPPRPGS